MSLLVSSWRGGIRYRGVRGYVLLYLHFFSSTTVGCHNISSSLKDLVPVFCCWNFVPQHRCHGTSLSPPLKPFQNASFPTKFLALALSSLSPTKAKISFNCVCAHSSLNALHLEFTLFEARTYIICIRFSVNCTAC